MVCFSATLRESEFDIYCLDCRYCGAWSGRGSVWRNHQIALRSCTLLCGNAGRAVLLRGRASRSSSQWWQRSEKIKKTNLSDRISFLELCRNYNFNFSLCNFLPCSFIPPQARPMEVQATRDFAEPRKLPLVANDLVTVIEHGWVRTEGRTAGQ